MTITVHRGTHQIGGCITEIATDSARIFIDMGTELPGAESASEFVIDGVTTGAANCDAIFITHYHGDHIGLYKKVLNGIPIYIGEVAKEILLTLANRIKDDEVQRIEGFETFKALDKIVIKDIVVTPLMIDHSAFDAYMFIIEADGIRILHTGDFRLHGVRGGKTLKMLGHYARDIDYIICEGTTLSRDGEPPMSEYELQQKAAELMKTFPYVFVLCSSTNIDQIGAFYHSNPKGRLFVCDEYQKKQLMNVRNVHAERSSFYDFKYVLDYAPNLDGAMKEKGFCMLIRQGEYFRRVIDKYKDNCLIIYSMWTGYLDDRAKNQALCDFLAPYRHRVLHTSGHASPADIKRLYDAVQPKRGLIPIHSDDPELFERFVPREKLIALKDGEEMK